MEKVLSQDEIDALFGAARRGSGPGSSSAPRHIVPCNFRREGQINKEQVRSIATLQESFARNLTHSLGAYLRVLFDVNLVSVEQLPYAEFAQRLPETTYATSISLQPLAAVGVVHIDLALAFPIIDLLLGGQGKTQTRVRDITEIEDQILESVVKIVCQELQSTWQPLLDLELRFDQRMDRNSLQRLLPPDERVLALSFEVHMPDVRGMLNLVFSAGVSSALMKKLSQEWSHRRFRGPTLGDTTTRERILECSFDVELRVDQIPLRGSELLGLQRGRVVALRARAGEAARLTINGNALFAAQPARQGMRRAAHVAHRLAISNESRKGES